MKKKKRRTRTRRRTCSNKGGDGVSGGRGEKGIKKRLCGRRTKIIGRRIKEEGRRERRKVLLEGKKRKGERGEEGGQGKGSGCVVIDKAVVLEAEEETKKSIK